MQNMELRMMRFYKLPVLFYASHFLFLPNSFLFVSSQEALWFVPGAGAHLCRPLSSHVIARA